MHQVGLFQTWLVLSVFALLISSPTRSDIVSRGAFDPVGTKPTCPHDLVARIVGVGILVASETSGVFFFHFTAHSASSMMSSRSSRPFSVSEYSTLGGVCGITVRSTIPRCSSSVSRSVRLVALIAPRRLFNSLNRAGCSSPSA